MRRTALAFTIVLVLAPAGTARGEKEPLPPATLADVESRIREVLVRTKTPGAGVALVSREAVLWQAGLGKADVASGRDVTPETLFRIGSISKTFVGLCGADTRGGGETHARDPVARHGSRPRLREPVGGNEPREGRASARTHHGLR